MLMRRRTREEHIDELFQRLLQPESRAERYAGIPHHCMLEYEDYNQIVCRCWLRTYPRGDRLVAIATDLTYRLSEGASITNAIELVAREICERFQIRPRDLVMIEHYNWRGTENADCLGKNAEHYYFADLRWGGRKRGFESPKWLRLSKDKVESLIGTPLSDWYTEAVTLSGEVRHPPRGRIE